MGADRPTIVVTGASGNLGLRLLPLLAQYNVVAIDMHPPAVTVDLPNFVYEQLDLGEEESCDRLIAIIRRQRAIALVHLAFVIDPQRTGVLDKRRMWQINVAGTARVLEAITHANRLDQCVRTVIVPSSVSVYGPELPRPVTEDAPLGAHTLTYAVHKKAADEVVQARAVALGDCATYLLRPHIFVGRSMQNYLVGAFRGTPSGSGRLGSRLREKGYRLPLCLPRGKGYLEKKFQFIHVDDMARLIAFLVDKSDSAPGLHVLNVAGRGESLTIAHAAAVANAKILRLPGRFICRTVLELLWNLGICAVPPDALPYICGSYTMDTGRLQRLLGGDYERIIRYTCETGLVDCFADSHPTAQDRVAAAK